MSENRNKGGFRQFLDKLGHAFRHMLFHNGWLKLIAVLISLTLWAGLISQDENITRDKTFQNVNVNVTGTETMKNNGYIVVSDLDELLNNVSIVAAVPQKQYAKAEASAYNVRLDLSRINGTGEQELKLLSTNSQTYGKVVSSNPSSINVLVEDYFVRPRIPVSVSVEGDTPEGWYMSPPTVDPSLVAVSGPGSLVQTISRAKVFINTADIEWKEGTILTGAEIHLFNRSGAVVESPLLSITSSSLTIDTVLIETNLLPKTTFETADLVQINGTVANGYRISDVRISPETVYVADRAEVLEQMHELPMDRTSVNVNGLKETTVFQLKIQKPSEDSIISNETVTVTVEIEADES